MQSTKQPHILSLMLLSAFAIMGALVLTPALPAVSYYFGKSVGTTQLTVTIFLLGYAGGQLIYGPIANRYGRKPAFTLGIVIATLGSLFSILASPFESFGLLLVGRLLEALGSSAGLVVAMTVIGDYYTDTQARKIIATIMLAFAIVPGVAVLLGGLITEYLDWQSCFYFLLVYGLLLMIPIWRLPETLKQKDPHALKTKKLLCKYAAAFKNKRLVGFACLCGLSSAAIYSFGAEGPFIGIHLLGVPAGVYGLLGLTPFIGTFFGGLLAMRISQFNPIRVLCVAFFLELAAAVAMFVCFIFGFISLWSLLMPMALLCVGHSLLVTMAMSLSLQQAKDKSNGSAVTNFANMSMPVFITLLLGLLHVAAAWILPVIIFIALGVMLVIFVGVLNFGRGATSPQ